MKPAAKVMLVAIGLLLAAGGYVLGHQRGRADVRRLEAEWFPSDAFDANVLTLHLKARADGTAELNCLPIGRRDLIREVGRRIASFGVQKTGVCIWSEGATTFGQMRASTLDAAVQAGNGRYELRFLSGAKLYHVRIMLPCPDRSRENKPISPWAIDAAGGLSCDGKNVSSSNMADAMDSLGQQMKLKEVWLAIDPACPMDRVFAILAAAVDHGLSAFTLVEPMSNPGSHTP